MTGTQPFTMSDTLRNTGDLQKYAEKWTSWAVFNFNIKHRPVQLNSLFHYVEIKVYGYPFFAHSAILELNIFLNGISKTLDKFVIFRFRHLLENHQVSDEDDYRSLFSYAFLISDLDTNTGDPVWVFFVNIAAKETGKKVDEVENLISMMSKNIETVRREEYDIRLDELFKFLLNHSNGFGSKRGDDSPPFLYTASRYRFGTDFENAYLKFLDRYDSEDYPQAMRDFRALIQNALEITCNNLNIPVQIDRKKIDIPSLVGLLIGQNRA